MPEQGRSKALLLVDTCGERGSVALVRGQEVLAEMTLPERAASTGLLAAVRRVLDAGQIPLRELSSIGVVNGPGSFTGLRVGLAVCKGLCDAAGLPLAAVSRLKVLADAAELQEGYAVLRAGRDQVYVREVQAGLSNREWLVDVGVLSGLAKGKGVVYTEASLLPLLQSETPTARYVALSAKDALRAVRECLATGGSDLALADANYVRDEEAIYARPGG